MVRLRVEEGDPFLGPLRTEAWCISACNDAVEFFHDLFTAALARFVF